MSVWILECYDSGDYNATFWQDQKDALTQACSEIQEAIASDLDLDDEETHRIAKSILDHIARADYTSAINEWNDYQNGVDYPYYYYVTEKDISNNPAPLKNWVLGPFHSTTTVHNEEDEQNSIPTLPPMQNPGATCRGPCKTYNEYAYADRMDSTYCCYSCKMFGHK